MENWTLLFCKRRWTYRFISWFDAGCWSILFYCIHHLHYCFGFIREGGLLMKKLTRKIVALTLSLVMCISFSNTTFATVWNFFCKLRSSMIIKRLNGSFLRLSRCLFNSKNERTCQEHPEKSGCIFLGILFRLTSSVGRGTWFPVHHVLFPSCGSTLSIFLQFQKYPDIVPSSAPGNLEIRFSACSIYDSMNLVILWHS